MQLKVVRFVSGCVCGFAAAMIVLILSSPAAAQTTYYWTTAPSGPVQAGNGAWDVSGAPHWATDAAGDGVVSWQAGGNADFYANSSPTSTIAVNGNQSVNNITFDGSGYAISGGSLTVSGAIITNQDATIGSALVGTNNLAKSGAGTLTLTGVSNFGNPGTANTDLAIHQGTIQVNPGAVLSNQLAEIDVGDTAGLTGKLVMSSGTALIPYPNNNYTGVNVGMNGGTGVLTLTGNSLLDVTVPSGGYNLITIGFGSASSGTISVGGNSAMKANIGPGGASKITVGEAGGAGVLIVQDNALVQTSDFRVGSTAYGGGSATGTVHLNGGTLSVPYIENDSGTTGVFYFNGGTLQPTAGGNIVNAYGAFTTYVSTSGAVIDSDGQNVVFNQSLAHDPALGGADGGLTKVGNGELTLTTVAYNGPTIVNGGTLQAPNPPAAVSGSVATGACLSVQSGNGATGWSSAQIGALLNPSDFTWAGSAALAIDTSSVSVALGGNITQPLSLVKLGANTLTLTGSNTYSGGATVSGGALVAANAMSLPGYATTGAVGVAAGATLSVQLGDGVSTGWSNAQVGNLLAGASWAAGAAFGIDTTNGNATYSGNITQAVQLNKLGANTLTLNAVNTYSGNTLISQGTLQLGNNLAIEDSALDISGAGALAFASGVTTPVFGGLTGANDLTLPSAVASLTLNVGSGVVQNYSGALGSYAASLTLAKTGAGMQILSGANAYSGPTQIDQGVLSLASPASLPSSSSVSVSGGAVLAVQPNGWTGSQINALLGAVAWYSNAAFGMDTTNGDATYSGNLASQLGVGLTKVGPNTLTLSGSNTYTGGTVVNQGTLEPALATALPGNATGYAAPNTVSVAAGAALAVPTGDGASTGWNNAQINTLVGAATWGGSTSVLGIDTTNGNFTYSGGITQALGLTKLGPNALTLTGANAYTGQTILSGGTLQFSSAVNQTLNGNVSGGGTLAMAGPAALTLNGNISGSGAVVTTGGTLTLAGANSYTGGTMISGGLLSVNVLNNTSSSNIPANSLFAFSGNINVNGGTLQYTGTGGVTNMYSDGNFSMGTGVVQVVNPNANLTLAGNIYWGNITKTGPGTLTISGANQGDWQSVLQGALVLTNAGGYPSSGVYVAPGAMLQFAANNNNVGLWTGVGVDGTFDFNGTSDALNGLGGSGLVTNSAISTTSTLSYGWAPYGGPPGGTNTFSGAIKDGAGVMALVVTGGYGQGSFGVGDLTLTGTGNAYGGGTTIAGGALQIGDGSTGPGSLPGNVSVGSLSVSGYSAQGALIFDTPAGMSLTASGNISGNIGVAGGLSKTGAGLLTLTGNNTYTGGTTVSQGILQIGDGATSAGSLPGNVVISSTAAGALSFDTPATRSLTCSGNISGTGEVSVSGGGMLILSGNNAYSGPTTVNGGTLQIGNGGSGEGLTSSITMSNGATVAFNHADPLSYGGAISGSGQLVKLGTGVLDLSGTSTYSGPTTISAGTVELDGNGNNLPLATALTIASGGVLDMAGVPQTVGSLSGSAGAIVMNRYPNYPSTLTVAPSSGATTFAGNIVGSNALALSGSGALTLSGTNTYTGGTTVSGGTLDIAAPSALSGSGLVTIAAGGRLVLGSGAGIGSLLAASSPAASGAVALSAAVSAPATIGGYENTSGNMATLGGAPVSSQGDAGSAVGGSATAVPEPGTMVLLAVAAVGLIGWVWRRLDRLASQ